MVFAIDALGIMIMVTYETFAAVYDAVMDDSLYDRWTDFSLRHLPKTKERKKLLEPVSYTHLTLPTTPYV